MVSMAEGESLNVIWDDLPLVQKNHVHAQCRKAVSILRRQSIWIARQDVPFSRRTNAVTMVDARIFGSARYEGAMMSSINLTC